MEITSLVEAIGCHEEYYTAPDEIAQRAGEISESILLAKEGILRENPVKIGNNLPPMPISPTFGSDFWLSYGPDEFFSNIPYGPQSFYHTEPTRGKLLAWNIDFLLKRNLFLETMKDYFFGALLESRID